MQTLLKDLVGIGYHDGKSVLYDEVNQRFVIEVKRTKDKEMEQYKEKFPEIASFVISISLLVGILSRKISLSGFLPLVVGDILVVLACIMLYRIVTPKAIDAVNFNLEELNMIGFLNEAKKHIRILYLTIWSSALVSLVSSIVYLLSSEFVFLFTAVSTFAIIPLLLGTKLEKRRKIINKLYQESGLWLK